MNFVDVGRRFCGLGLLGVLSAAVGVVVIDFMVDGNGLTSFSGLTWVVVGRW